MKINKYIEVNVDWDPAGVECLRIRKSKGRLTLDEITEACKAWEYDFYMIAIKAMDEDYDQYYMVDDFEGDYITCYRAATFFDWRAKE